MAKQIMKTNRMGRNRLSSRGGNRRRLRGMRGLRAPKPVGWSKRLGRVKTINCSSRKAG